MVARPFFGLLTSVTLASQVLKKRGLSHVMQPVWLSAYRFFFLFISHFRVCLLTNSTWGCLGAKHTCLVAWWFRDVVTTFKHGDLTTS